MAAVTAKVTCVHAQFRPSIAGGKKHDRKQGTPEMDIIVLGIGILFFLLSLAYVKACDRI
ncbi:hypothetical protein ORS3428_27320 [Mesorhizobium sp. ORS 3428]|nr:hypothetical protein ORS3428_27320 [Mesorhizobium sp. ORS 3428]